MFWPCRASQRSIPGGNSTPQNGRCRLQAPASRRSWWRYAPRSETACLPPRYPAQGLSKVNWRKQIAVKNQHNHTTRKSHTKGCIQRGSGHAPRQFASTRICTRRGGRIVPAYCRIRPQVHAEQHPHHCYLWQPSCPSRHLFGAIAPATRRHLSRRIWSSCRLEAAEFPRRPDMPRGIPVEAVEVHDAQKAPSAGLWLAFVPAPRAARVRVIPAASTILPETRPSPTLHTHRFSLHILLACTNASRHDDGQSGQMWSWMRFRGKRRRWGGAQAAQASFLFFWGQCTNSRLNCFEFVSAAGGACGRKSLRTKTEAKNGADEGRIELFEKRNICSKDFCLSHFCLFI